MRRAAVLAVLLVLALGGVAQAKPPVAMMNGHYTYNRDGDPAQPREVTVNARATDPAVGKWTWTLGGTTYAGTSPLLLAWNTVSRGWGPTPFVGLDRQNGPLRVLSTGEFR
jgi:hypothetical protein